jgi:mono/diheme cytochrome c family protein
MQNCPGAAACRCEESHGSKRPVRRRLVLLSSVVLLASAWLAMPAHHAQAADKHAVARGRYLVAMGSCTDCHTPGHFLGKEDAAKFLGGSDVGFGIPGLGVFVGPNLTPDKATGLGNWSPAQIVTALTEGVTPEGRTLAPAMPWHNYANMTKSDALAIAAYLKSLPPVSHQVAGPFGPKQTPTTFVMTVVPGDVYARIANPPPATK